MLKRLATALLAGLVLRLLWIALVPMVLVSDPAAYDAMARVLLEHGVYGFEPDEPGVTWPPGTSALYGMLYALPGSDVLAAKLFNVAISTLNIWLAYLVADRLFGARTAILSAWAMALWPQMIFFTTLTASETPFIALLLAGTLFWERAREGHILNALTAGVCLALACYFRSVALLLPVALLIGDVLRGMNLVRAATRIVITMAVMAACIAPWTYRNYTVFGEPITLSANFGTTFYMGNGPGTNGRHGSAKAPAELVQGLSYVERAKVLEELAMEEIRANPGAFVTRSLKKLVIIHDRETIGVSWNREALRPLIGETGMTALQLGATVYWWMILATGLLAVFWQLFRGIGWSLIGSIPMAIWGYFATIHAIVLAADRFHMAQAPFIAMLGASMIAGITLARQERS